MRTTLTSSGKGDGNDADAVGRLRVGLGYDIHALARGCRLVLGGVDISAKKGCVGHSDADALLHAVIDSLLSASHLGDIGDMFPPSLEKWRGVSSVALLKMAYSEVVKAGYEALSISCIVKLQTPHLAPYKRAIEKNIASILGMEERSIGLTVKTGEKMGDVGRGRAVEAYATSLLFLSPFCNSVV